MTRFPVSTSNQQTIHGALELSKNSWLLAIRRAVTRVKPEQALDR